MSDPMDKEPSMDELMKMSKEDLERLKLAREIRTQGKEPEPPKRGGGSETFRVIVVAAIGGLITFTVNWMLEDRKADIALRTKEQEEFLANQSRCYQEPDLLRKAQCACELMDRGMPFDPVKVAERRAELSRICEAKDAYLAQAARIAADTGSAEMQRVKPLLNASESRIDSMQLILKTESDAAVRERTERELLAARQHSDSLERQNAEMKRIKEEMQKLTAMQKTLSDILDKSDQEIKDATKAITKDRSPTQWFKPGKSLEYKDRRVVLRKINADQIVVDIYASGFSNNRLQSDQRIAVGQPLSVVCGLGCKFNIVLESIGQAGDNPFTKGAYVHFETTK